MITITYRTFSDREMSLIIETKTPFDPEISLSLGVQVLA